MRVPRSRSCSGAAKFGAGSVELRHSTTEREAGDLARKRMAGFRILLYTLDEDQVDDDAKRTNGAHKYKTVHDDDM